MARSATTDDVRHPSDIPSGGWWDILMRVKSEVGTDHVTMIAASIAFYGLLAIFPAIAATIAIYGLLFDPQQIQDQLATASSALPTEAGTIVSSQARKVAQSTHTGLSLAAVVGALFALWSASRATKALIEGINMIYDETEKRGFIRLNLTALALTLAMIAVVLVSLGLIAVLPGLLGSLGLGGLARAFITWLRWPLLALVAMVALAILYRLAPSRDTPRWRWVSWGAVIATGVWIDGSMAFSYYVRNFANYNETYGSLGAVIILLMWFWLSAFIILAGAELNAEMERQIERGRKRGANAGDDR
jgi:membrane protein